MTKNKYLISPNYLMQLENDELRDRIKELKIENDEARNSIANYEAKIKEFETKLLDSSFGKGING
jgi:regulator of replication initiation timing